MDGKIIAYAIFLIAIIGGVMGILYTTDVDEAQNEGWLRGARQRNATRPAVGELHVVAA